MTKGQSNEIFFFFILVRVFLKDPATPSVFGSSGRKRIIKNKMAA